MYATKPLSLFKSHPEAASGPPPDGWNSGYLVMKGTSDEAEETCCWGLFPDRRVRELPFPQNCVLTVRYTVSNGQRRRTKEEAIVFVPVPDQPLASNRYYAVIAKGRCKGLVRVCSREEDMASCYFCRCIKDVEPRPFDPADIYQQMEIVQRRRGSFTARAVAADGFPSSLYRNKYWEVYASMTKKFDLGEAVGLDASLWSRQLVVVGRWYTLFFLIKEAGVTPREQMESSAFYEVMLELRWEPVHAYGGGGGGPKLASKRVYIGGSVEAEEDRLNSRQDDAYMWFKAAAVAAGQHLGVCRSVLDRMRWEESRGGWVDEDEDRGKVAGGSVLVERFVVKRLDGAVVVALYFVHMNKVRAKQM